MYKDAYWIFMYDVEKLEQLNVKWMISWLYYEITWITSNFWTTCNDIEDAWNIRTNEKYCIYRIIEFCKKKNKFWGYKIF